MKVWFQLFLGNAGLLPVYVTLKKNDVIADLMEAVKSTCENSLQGVSLAQLRMYPPGTKVPISEEDDDASLDPGDLVDDLNGGSSSKDAFVIVAPDIGTYFDLMEYLLLYCSSQLLILTYHFVSSIPYKYLATVEKTKERRNARNEMMSRRKSP